MSWTHALRQIVLNCYKYHGRDDLLPPSTYGEPMATSVTEQQQTTVITVKTIVENEKIDHRLQNDSRVSIITSTGVPSGQTSVIETAPPSVMKTEPMQVSF